MVIRDIEYYIDNTIDDIDLRTIEWAISINTLCDRPPEVLRYKWHRLAHIQGKIPSYTNDSKRLLRQCCATEEI